jgi:hypothetical protein
MLLIYGIAFSLGCSAPPATSQKNEGAPTSNEIASAPRVPLCALATRLPSLDGRLIRVRGSFHSYEVHYLSAAACAQLVFVSFDQDIETRSPAAFEKLSQRGDAEVPTVEVVGSVQARERSVKITIYSVESVEP